MKRFYFLLLFTVCILKSNSAPPVYQPESWFNPENSEPIIQATSDCYLYIEVDIEEEEESEALIRVQNGGSKTVAPTSFCQDISHFAFSSEDTYFCYEEVDYGNAVQINEIDITSLEVIGNFSYNNFSYSKGVVLNSNFLNFEPKGNLTEHYNSTVFSLINPSIICIPEISFSNSNEKLIRVMPEEQYFIVATTTNLSYQTFFYYYNCSNSQSQKTYLNYLATNMALTSFQRGECIVSSFNDKATTKLMLVTFQNFSVVEQLQVSRSNSTYTNIKIDDNSFFLYTIDNDGNLNMSIYQVSQNCELSISKTLIVPSNAEGLAMDHLPDIYWLITDGDFNSEYFFIQAFAVNISNLEVVDIMNYENPQTLQYRNGNKIDFNVKGYWVREPNGATSFTPALFNGGFYTDYTDQGTTYALHLSGGTENLCSLYIFDANSNSINQEYYQDCKAQPQKAHQLLDVQKFESGEYGFAYTNQSEWSLSFSIYYIHYQNQSESMFLGEKNIEAIFPNYENSTMLLLFTDQQKVIRSALYAETISIPSKEVLSNFTIQTNQFQLFRTMKLNRTLIMYYTLSVKNSIVNVYDIVSRTVVETTTLPQAISICPLGISMNSSPIINGYVFSNIGSNPCVANYEGQYNCMNTGLALPIASSNSTFVFIQLGGQFPFISGVFYEFIVNSFVSADLYTE